MKRAPTKKTVTIIHEDRLTLTGEDLLNLLHQAGVIVPLYNHAEVTFTVPSGGDWSGDDIAIDDEHPIVVTWTNTDRQESEISRG